jgi:hypothetical protein
MSCPVIEVIVSGAQPTISVVEVSTGIQQQTSVVDLSTLHNSLVGLQGGAVGEYYHLSSDQYTQLTGFQSQNFNLTATTTGADFTELLTTGSGTINVVSGYAVLFEGQISAFDTTNLKAAAWDYKCLLANKTGLTQKVGPSQLFTIADDSSGSWQVYINQDTGINYLQLKVKGEASTTIKWNASVEATSVS